MIPHSNGYGYPPTQERERPVGELFQELAQDTRSLVALELELAKTELSQKAAQTSKGVGFMAAGGFIAYAGFLAILAAIVIGLANFIPAWLSALLVGLVVVVVAYAVFRKGMNDLKPEKMTPKQTLDSLKENKEWVQEQVR